MPTQVKYLCCQCHAEMTAEVEGSCSTGASHVPMLTDPVMLVGASEGTSSFRSMTSPRGETQIRVREHRLTGPETVTLVCPNGHTCDYPCMDESLAAALVEAGERG